LDKSAFHFARPDHGQPNVWYQAVRTPPTCPTPLRLKGTGGFKRVAVLVVAPVTSPGALLSRPKP
jgi:hypothetical protein